MNQLNASTDRARKTFAMPLPPNTSAVADKTSTTTPSEPNLSQDESSTHSTPGTPSKRKKRYYKGGTYGLFLSKKRRKLKEQKKANEKIDSSVKSSGVGAEGEESSQSFAANSESDGELDGESSDMSNADDERDVEDIANEINESNDDLHEEFVDAVEGSGEQPVLINEDVSKNGIPEDASDNIGSQSHTMPPKEANPCNVGDHVKRRPGRGRRRVDGLSEEDYQSPPSSTNSKSNASKESRQLSPNKDSSGHKGESESTPGLTNGTTRQVFQLAANNVTSSVVQNPNRKTLLRISTAGSVMSGDTTGTQLGAELSKFVLVKDKSTAQMSNCMCSAKPLIDSSQKDISKGKPLFCQAIDCFDEKLIGCCNQVRLTSLFRSSRRVPYRILCEVHLARLRRHHCCPGCGLFCTQGEFNECFCVKKQIHLFHKKCQVERPQDPKTQHCLHCGNVSQARTVRLEMNGPLTNNTYYLQQTSILKTPKARIAMTKRKGRQKTPTISEEYEEPGIEYTIPATQKILSLAGLPFGPQRKQLEELLVNLSADKQSIRLTIQHNKNFYAVAKSGEVDKVLSILAQGFDPNFPFEDNDNETPLHAAANCGHILVVHLLI
ncbi:unnamed protein product, partial [Oppiella nova]